MSLFFVHRLLIATAIVFCAGFAVRGAVITVRSGDVVAAVLTVVSAIGAGVLGWYLRWLIRNKSGVWGSGQGTGGKRGPT